MQALIPGIMIDADQDADFSKKKVAQKVESESESESKSSEEEPATNRAICTYKYYLNLK